MLDFETKRIIDSNGTKYLVGWDQHGWFTIGRVYLYDPDEVGEADSIEVTHDGATYAAALAEEATWESFTPDGADAVMDAIEEGR